MTTGKGPSQADIDSEIQSLHRIEAGAAHDDPNPSEAVAPIEPDSRSAQVQPDARPDPVPTDRITAGDRVRANIAARFRQSRGEGLDFHGDYNDPTQSYGGYGAPRHEAADPVATGPVTTDPVSTGPAATPDPAPADARPLADPAAQPNNLRRLKIHGVDMWLSPEQVDAEAAKSLAAGNILETAKEIKDVVSRSTVSSPDQGDRAHARDPQRSAQPGGDPVDPNQDPIDQLVHDLQFGDPDAVRERLRHTIDSRAEQAARRVLTTDRFGNERNHRIEVLAEFQAANADLADDPYAPAAITNEVNRQYAADLAALGILADQIPKTAADIADWHMQARISGKPVRDIRDIFEASKSKFLAWRGGATRQAPADPAPANPALGGQHHEPPARPTAPRVELSLDRTQRRAAVPTQPQRASAPPRQPAPVPPGGDRSAAIMNMRKSRGQVTA